MEIIKTFNKMFLLVDYNRNYHVKMDNGIKFKKMLHKIAIIFNYEKIKLQVIFKFKYLNVVKINFIECVM